MNSSYGTNRPAYVEIEDIEVYFTYSPDRYSPPSNVIQILEATDVLTPITTNTDVTFEGETANILGGLYNLRLPQDKFSEIGIYTIHIRPKEIKVTIVDCGALSNLPNVKGIILNGNDSVLNGRTNFDGFRVEYYENGVKNKEMFRIVRSSFRVEPVSEAISNSITQKSIKYRFNNSASLLFLTLAPSSINLDDTLVNSPYIGIAGQTIGLINTYFDPISIEVEITDMTVKELSYGIYGNQTKKITGDGAAEYTIYDDNGNVYRKYNLFQALNEFGNPEWEVRQRTEDNINNATDNFNTLIQSILNL